MTADSGGLSINFSKLLRRLDRPASDTCAGVARRISLQVVLFLVNHHRFADDRIRSAQTQFPFPIEMRFAGSIGLNVPEIALMVHGCHWPTVMLICRIEMRAG